ncbi:MAG: M28 family peptidase [Myxococcales bacterium]|nr:M28 family peptidase [Myxococcales bacterium]
MPIDARGSDRSSSPPSRGTSEHALALIRELVELGPRRVAGSVCERQAHDRLAREFREITRESGSPLHVALRPFRFNTHLYAVLALHFGVATLGSLATLAGYWPLGLLLHLLAAASYYGDSTRRFYWLRRLFTFQPSQNLVATAPARDGERTIRVVVIAHVDAAYTGVMFHPEVVRRGTRPPPIPGLEFMAKGMLVVTAATALLALVDLLSGTGLIGASASFVALAALSVPPVITFALNLEVVLRDQVVPGANDNLSGSAAAVALAARLVPRKPPGAELVFVVTGAEEAGTGGAYALAREVSLGAWDRRDTVIIGVDGLSNGALRRVVDGELMAVPMAPWLDRVLDQVSASELRFREVTSMNIPVGATDAMPFHARGYDAVCLSCVDPQIGAPRHYHRLSDTPDNLDPAQYADSIDYAERLVDAILEARA